MVKSSNVQAVEKYKKTTIKKAIEYINTPSDNRKRIVDMNNKEIDTVSVIEAELKKLEKIELNEDSIMEVRDILKYINSFIIYKYEQ